jgi:TonB family protein
LPTSPTSLGAPHFCSHYPQEAKDAHEEGRADLTFLVTENGETADIKVSHSTGSKALDEEAISCASKWRYRPAMQNGKPVAMRWSASAQWFLGDATSMPDTVPAKPAGPQTCSRPSDIPITPGTKTALALEIEEDGHVSMVYLEKSSGNSALDALAGKCAKTWHFQPATKDGAPTFSTLHVALPWG